LNWKSRIRSSIVNIPALIKVGPHVYAVDIKDHVSSDDGSSLNGLCDFDAVQIILRRGMCRSKEKETLLHEILHACTFPFLTGKTVDDEAFVDATAAPLLAVLQ
jgi:hypothetical protein